MVCFTSLAQCPDFSLSSLQNLQRGSDAQKESQLRSLGFDLDSKTGNSLRYNKCWRKNQNDIAIYEQVIYWNTATGNITYLSSNEEAYLALRSSIEGRGGQTNSLSNSDVYIGQVFRYKFAAQWLDGVRHWSIAISFK